MNEDQVKKLIEENNRRNYMSGSPDVAPHSHNGNDNLQIAEEDIIIGNKKQVQFVASNSATASSQILVPISIANLANPSRISFHGGASDNATGTHSKRATVTGELIFGDCKVFSKSYTATPTTVVDQTEVYLSKSSHFAASNAMYIDMSNLANTVVLAAPYLAAISDGSTTVALLTLADNSTPKQLVFNLVLASGWILAGQIHIT